MSPATSTVSAKEACWAAAWPVSIGSGIGTFQGLRCAAAAAFKLGEGGPGGLGVQTPLRDLSDIRALVPAAARW